MAAQRPSPILEINPRKVVAVEHPMIIKNIDNGIKTFGHVRPFERVLDSEDPKDCVPLFLRHHDPLCAPILSQNTPTTNVLIKVTVPKRTGRKRKRGSQLSYSGVLTNSVMDRATTGAQSDSVRSQGRRDDANELMSMLRDNVDKYTVEAVANIQSTHRYRAHADFLQVANDDRFAQKYHDVVESIDVEKLRQFKFKAQEPWQRNQDFIPPSSFTSIALPMNAGENADEDEPYKAAVSRVSNAKPPSSRAVENRIRDLKRLFNQRPIWTRRALGNQFPTSVDRRSPVLNEAIKHVAYPIREGPYRDTICKYGIDPRSKKRYREYLPISFMLGEEKKLVTGANGAPDEFDGDLRSHIFDGQRVNINASIWQLCDITDPLLSRLIRNTPYRDEFDAVSGLFYNGTWAKIRAVMRVKLEALVTKTTCLDKWFEATTMGEPDMVELGEKWRKGQRIPVPDIYKIAEDRNERMRKGLPYVDIGTNIPVTTFEKLRRSARAGGENAKKKGVPATLSFPATLHAPAIAEGTDQNEGVGSDVDADGDVDMDYEGIGRPPEPQSQPQSQPQPEPEPEPEPDQAGDVDSDATDEVDFAAVYKPKPKPAVPPRW